MTKSLEKTSTFSMKQLAKALNQSTGGAGSLSVTYEIDDNKPIVGSITFVSSVGMKNHVTAEVIGIEEYNKLEAALHKLILEDEASKVYDIAEAKKFT